MNYSVFRFTLNMHSHRSQASVATFKGDTAVRLLINLTDGGNPYVIADGCIAVISGTKADGTKLFNRCAILNNATVQYDFTEQTTSWAGVVNCELIIYGVDGNEITAPKFIIVVEEREVDIGDITSENERVALATLIASEESRIEAENLRNNNEATRVEAEATRVEAELSRSEVEAARVAAELSRVEAEETRVGSEEARKAAEDVRATAEAKRIEDEKTRNATYEACNSMLESAFNSLKADLIGDVDEVMEAIIEINEGGIEA